MYINFLNTHAILYWLMFSRELGATRSLLPPFPCVAGEVWRGVAGRCVEEVSIPGGEGAYRGGNRLVSS